MTAALLERVRLEQARCTVNPFRACELCDHGAGLQHLCLYTGRPVPAATARGAGGLCGPQAEYLRIGGDHLQVASRATWWGRHAEPARTAA